MRQGTAGLLRKASPEIVSEMLGHASASFTMYICQHIVNGMQEDAMALLDEVLPAGVSGTGASSRVRPLSGAGVAQW